MNEASGYLADRTSQGGGGCRKLLNQIAPVKVSVISKTVTNQWNDPTLGTEKGVNFVRSRVVATVWRGHVIYRGFWVQPPTIETARTLGKEEKATPGASPLPPKALFLSKGNLKSWGILESQPPPPKSVE